MNEKKEMHRKIHQSLKTSHYEEHKNRNPPLHSGTGMWALHSSQFKAWQANTTNDLLWISADPGCGKSVLARSLIDSQLNTEDQSICYFFFKDNSEQNDLSTALCALLHQLFSHRPQLLRHAERAWDENGASLNRERGELWRIFRAAATDSSAGQVLCILDGLDECKLEESMDLIKVTSEFYHSSSQGRLAQSCLKILITSRPYENIERQFGKYVVNLPHIRVAGELRNETIGAEIDIVCRAQIPLLAAELKLTDNVAGLLERRLLESEQRTYLWLHLVIKEIRETLNRTERGMAAVIDKLPLSVNEAYESILSRNREPETTRKLLSIVVAADRPLSLQEIDVALSIAEDEHEASRYGDIEYHSQNIEMRIRNLSGLFIYVSSESRVFLFHQTAKEFLLENEVVRTGMPNPNCWGGLLVEAQCHTFVAQICLRYLCFNDFDDQPFADKELSFLGPELDALDGPELAFMDYAATNWSFHLSKAATP